MTSYGYGLLEFTGLNTYLSFFLVQIHVRLCQTYLRRTRMEQKGTLFLYARVTRAYSQ